MNFSRLHVHNFNGDFLKSTFCDLLSLCTQRFNCPENVLNFELLCCPGEVFLVHRVGGVMTLLTEFGRVSAGDSSVDILQQYQTLLRGDCQQVTETVVRQTRLTEVQHTYIVVHLSCTPRTHRSTLLSLHSNAILFSSDESQQVPCNT